jgi:hypothetical protein
MHLMGWRPDELWRRLPRARRRFTEWIESMPDYLRQIDSHVGVAVLWAHKFNRSNSHIKASEFQFRS